MEINVAFRHSESSPVLRRHIEDKIRNKLSKYFIKPVMVHVILNVEGNRHSVEVSLTEDHNVFNAQETSYDMYYSVDGALARLERQLKKHKEIVKNHHKKSHRDFPEKRGLHFL